jgi:hypothetical protein
VQSQSEFISVQPLCHSWATIDIFFDHWKGFTFQRDMAAHKRVFEERRSVTKLQENVGFYRDWDFGPQPSGTNRSSSWGDIV